MPFTFCHPAIILPLTKSKKLSTSAMIIGSTAPDFEYFIRMDLIRTHSHDISAMFYFNLPLTLVLFMVFQKIVKTPLINHLPSFLYSRFNIYATKSLDLLSFKSIFWIILSAIIGIFSHLLWDSFTHKSGFFENHFSFQLKHFSIFGKDFILFQFLQFWSSIAGGIYILYFVIKRPSNKKIQITNLIYFWTVALIVAFLIIYIRQCDTITKLIATSISAGLIGLISAALFANIKIKLL